MELKNAVIVITGSGQGIGHAVKELLETAGAVVCSSSREESKGIAKVDVRKMSDVEKFMDDVIRTHGHIDCLINNAGVAHPVAPLEEISSKDYEQCIRTNVDGVFHGMKAVLPHMKEQGKGVIINIASRAGTKAHPSLSVYSASKYAVIGLTQSVARELQDTASQILCISISPGGVETRMREELFGKDDTAHQQSPEQVAQCILSVLSGETSVQSGADVQVVDGTIVI